ncbi:DUF6093 family protein [Brachybacterium sp. NBEC-018]|uniref:DUF6093 family protein n=1 Tax=Brachybacterium sp. NBEC-018 TaxID=2996004 RepID=UPI002174D459|nr:DUF6093 family protein [Brachybacterium sp. NBEC-018]UVY83797.1 DUF6093 family protein [Brachybacterium sp. NBEC-018]
MGDPPRYLVRAREIQSSVMPDACRIERSTGLVYNRETGEDEEQWTDVWAGECRLPRFDSASRGFGRVIVTGETITPATPTVKLPWHVQGVLADDRVTVTASVSPDMVGRILWVTAAAPRTFQSAVNLTCREVR